VAGGSYVGNVFLNSTELYDPSTGIWTLTGYLNYARVLHTSSLLTNGMVVVVGGRHIAGVDTNTVELYDPSAGIWMDTISMSYNRSLFTASVLTNGNVLAVGGPLAGNSSELFEL
ncbi:unnamed protein product, partial [Rotaria magnacalcarata]